MADELRAELARERARRDVLDVHDRVEDERASGSRLVEVARKLDLPLIELDAIDNTGRDAAGVDVSASVGGGEVVQAIFRAGPVSTPIRSSCADKGSSGSTCRR